MIRACKSLASASPDIKGKSRRSVVQTSKSLAKSRKIKHISEISDSIHKLNKADACALKLHYKSVASPEDIVCRRIDCVSIAKQVYVENLSASEIKHLNGKKGELDKLHRNVRSYIGHLNRIFNDDAVDDDVSMAICNSFMLLLLKDLEIGDFPLLLLRQYPSYFKARAMNVASELDFAVERESQIVLHFDTYKNSNKKQSGAACEEFRIAGGMIARAYSNYCITDKNYEKEVYAVRVLGTKFAFYKASITQEYLEALGIGKPRPSLEILRYPQHGKTKEYAYLDYGDSRERSIIVDMLVKIREELKDGTQCMRLAMSPS